MAPTYMPNGTPQTQRWQRPCASSIRPVHALTLCMSGSFATPWAVAHQGPLSMGFTRLEYWSGLPFPSPGDLTEQGFEPLIPIGLYYVQITSHEL